MIDVSVAAATISVRADALAGALTRVRHAAAADSARPILNGILLEGTETGLNVVAADNYRIARAFVDEDAGAPTIGWGRAVVRLDDLATLLAALKTERLLPVTLTHVPRQRLTVRGGYHELVLRVVDGEYPNYESVYALDVTAPRMLTVRGSQISEALAAAGSHEYAVHVVVGAPLEAIRFESTGYLEMVMPVRGPTALEESDMRPAPAWEEPLRRMPDGSPCWCVSADRPHDDWIHAPLCTQRREFIWDCARNFNPFEGIKASLGRALAERELEAEFPVGSVWRDNDPRYGKTMTITGGDRQYVYVTRENGRSGKVLAHRMRQGGSGGYTRVTAP